MRRILLLLLLLALAAPVTAQEEILALRRPTERTYWLGGDTYRTTFWTRPVAAPREGVADRLRGAVASLALPPGYEQIATTDNFTSNAGGDGMILSQDAVWATARSATTGTLVGGIGNAQGGDIGALYQIERGFAPFNTATIPDSALVTIVVFTYITSSIANANNDTLHVVASTQADPTALAAGDFDQIGGVSFANTLFSALTVPGANTFTLNAAGRANLSLTGYSLYGIRENFDLANIQPAGDNVISQTNLGANPFQLDVTYTVPAGFMRPWKTW